MTATLQEANRLVVDGRPHQVIATLDVDGQWTVQFTDEVTDIDAALASIVDEVREEHGRTTAAPVLHPVPPGPVPLPCSRCRRPIDRDQLVWLTPRTSSTLIRQVGCRNCAMAGNQ